MTLPAPAPGAAPRWKNPHRRLPAVRAVVQAAYLLILVGAGVEFATPFPQAKGRSSRSTSGAAGCARTGALLGVASFLLPQSVRRDPATCKRLPRVQRA